MKDSKNKMDLPPRVHLQLIIDERKEILSKYMAKQNAKKQYVKWQQDHIDELQHVCEKLTDDSFFPLFREINEAILEAIRTFEMNGLIVDIMWGKDNHRKGYYSDFYPELKIAVS